MKAHWKFLAGCMLFCIGFTSCTKQAPQLPSNKIKEVNSEAQTLLIINQRLTSKEDSLLETFAKRTDKHFVKNETGFWYRIDEPGNGQKIKNKSICTFSYRLLLTNGKMLQEGKKRIEIGKKEVVVGLEEGIKLLHRGDSATFIIPWYLGYGMKGNKPLVEPYTSIIYQIRLDK